MKLDTTTFSGIFVCLLLPAFLQAQAADSLRLLDTLAVQIRFATTDNLGNCYLITQQNTVEKYSPDGALLTRYSNNRLGTAAWLDVTNPLKILVWYADFRTVVFLNRSLTALGELNLISAGYPEVRTIAAAADGNLWLYDEVAFQLKKISPEGQTRFESQALNAIQPLRIDLRCIRDDGQTVLAADPALGILQFDVYAQFQRLLSRQGVTTFVLYQNKIAYLNENVLWIERLQNFENRKLALPESIQLEETACWLTPGYLFVQKEKLLERWQWE